MCVCVVGAGAGEGEPIFVHSLVTLAAHGVVLSWARLRQAGLHHINCQSQAYITCALGLAGLSLDVEATTWLRGAIDENAKKNLHSSVCPWLKATLFVFRPPGRSSTMNATLLPLPPTPTAAFAARYLEATRARCPYTESGCNATLPA